MDKKEQEFLKRLRETFRAEADEHLRALSAGLIELEKASGPQEGTPIIEVVFREAHSLKGAARSVNLKEIEALCQPLESALAALKRNEIVLSKPLFDLLHQAVDSLAQLVATMEAEQTSAERAALRELSRRLAEAAQGGESPVADTNPGGGAPSRPDAPPPGQPPARKEGSNRPGKKTPVAKNISQPGQTAAIKPAAKPVTLPQDLASIPGADTPHAPVKEKAAALHSAGEAMPLASETVRIPISKLDPMLLQAEEMIQAKLTGGQRAAELRQIQEALVTWKIDREKWKAGHPAHSSQMPEWETGRLEALEGKVNAIRQVFEQDQRSLRHMVDDHLEAMKQVLMLPVSTLVEVFPRLVRDLAREQGKEVELELRGTELEIDKRILEELKDPLIHLVRNCMDHGIEKPERRMSQGKTRGGMLTISFNAKDSRQVEILVSDDGAGINLDKVRAAALREGLLTADALGKMDDQETLALIFQSGLTTSEILTDLSGRGLGLAIVREKAEKLGGSVTVETHPGTGTTFRLLVPLTLTTFRGILVKAYQQVFILPSSHVERALRMNLNEIKTIENRETIRLDGQILSLVKLGEVLELPQNNNGVAGGEGFGRQRKDKKATVKEAAPTDHVPVLILVSAGERLAVQVDEVLAEEEVLVKGLGKQLQRVRNIAGATVLGDGGVVPVLNIADLINSAVCPGALVGAPAAVNESSTRTNRILVAEDSITARTLLKNILETGGYQVTIAVDGADAFTQLRSGEFDLLVSDVDMPRMSGFELTTKIRADKKLAELPVVLVTALESRPDRERGIEVGANAYIIKSSFDQSNLLEVIQRLL
ncbi:hybrid sensor histidine kinase/response regulator [bacterium]|nr:MAG: hybrid sensor histidine kinase/response regulator [bacterium]